MATNIKRQVAQLLGLPRIQPALDFQSDMTEIYLGDGTQRATSIEHLRDAVIASNMQANKAEMRIFGQLESIQFSFGERFSLIYWKNPERTIVWKRMLKTALIAGCILFVDVAIFTFFKGAKQNRLFYAIFFLLNAVAVRQCVLSHKALKQRTKTTLEETLEEVFTQHIIIKPSSQSQVDASFELGNEKKEDGNYFSPLLVEEIPLSDITYPRYILIGKNLFLIQEALQAMLTRENCFNKEIPHPMEVRSLDGAEEKAFLDTLQDLLCIQNAQDLLNLWNVRSDFLDECEAKVRRDIVYFQLDGVAQATVLQSVKNKVACYVRVTKFYHLIGQKAFDQFFGNMKKYVIQPNTYVTLETTSGDIVIDLAAG
ncbi:MAG: hypothetical protein K940chlam8_00831 [Chlamydiae bacterium]|nr:hypothetical protein [Chlamydiota bacterium]